MLIATPELFSPDLFIVIGFIGGLVSGLVGGLFGGRSKSKSGPPAYAQEAGRALLDYALGRESDAIANLPTGADLLAAAGPTFGEQMTMPGVNWFDVLGGGGMPTGMAADGTSVGNALGGSDALGAVFNRLAERQGRNALAGMMGPKKKSMKKMRGGTFNPMDSENTEIMRRYFQSLR